MFSLTDETVRILCRAAAGVKGGQMAGLADEEAASGPKERTRRLLVEAAHELLRTGGPLTVEAVAKVAGVSRATAYRYFSNNDTVVLHATLPLTNDPLEDLQELGTQGEASGDAPERVAALVRSMGEWAFDHETELRTVLRLSLTEGSGGAPAPRRASTNRGRWIAAALESLPDYVTAASRERLAAALTPLFGADAVVWTRDIAELSRDPALAVLEWMARSLVEATLTADRPVEI